MDGDGYAFSYQEWVQNRCYPPLHINTTILGLLCDVELS
jgi:hypothetical protein